MDEKEKILAKIQKLLKVAESGSGATDSEVERALNHVERLLKTSGLSAEDVASAGDTQQAEVFIEEEMNICTTVYNWEKFLLHKIADTTLCKMLYGKKCIDLKVDKDDLYYKYGFRKSWKCVTVVYFCGRPCDIALAQYLYKYLRSVIIARSKGLTGTSRDDYCKGIVIALAPKLESFRVNVNALVPVGLDDWISEKYPKLGTTRGYKKTNPSSDLIRGMKDGENIAINRAISPLGITYKG